MNYLIQGEKIVQMGALNPPSISKTQKVFIGEDLIGKLPDHILLYVLSFLPIKDVLTTSVLSTRWRYLWTSISNIDFDQYSAGYMSGMKENIETSFLDSMERVLKDHDPTCIRKFSLVARCMGISSSRINSWVSLALSREVQELQLDISSETPFVWPNSLFAAESLRILKLRIYSIFNVPSFVHFSNLKTLHLRELAFPGDESTNQFFTGCPVLQELVLLNCAWKHTKRVTISIPTLREFKFLEDSYYSDYDLVLDCVVMIYAENLVSLDVKGYLTVEVSLCNLASLVNARINVLDCGMEKDNSTQRAFKLINGIRNVKSLALSGVTIEFLADRNDLKLQAGLPVFHNLTHLKMNAEFLCEDGSYMFKYFLQKSPNVEFLDVWQEFYFAVNDWVMHVAPLYLKRFLKTASIKCWVDGDLKNLRYLFENADSMERVTIFCPNELEEYLEMKKEINYQLQGIGKGTRNVEIEFREGWDGNSEVVSIII
ncbi:hypothetical protein Patl1_05019 [Pistacia atlantica]|uniref:Uncharacterized protein n=1 Tax=Pistacia atlantica TaxID=434234 RepID=A0ACC1BPG7_9ROSI|nr:hypothetical protein Patl1_05019 [Pistacia atlantica]